MSRHSNLKEMRNILGEEKCTVIIRRTEERSSLAGGEGVSERQIWTGGCCDTVHCINAWPRSLDPIW